MTQSAEIKRVRDLIEPAVLDFVARVRALPPPCFFGSELEEDVRAKTNCTPGSPTRILRLLRAEGAVAYVVADRSRSLYALTDAGEATRAVVPPHPPTSTESASPALTLETERPPAADCTSATSPHGRRTPSPAAPCGHGTTPVQLGLDEIARWR